MIPHDTYRYHARPMPRLLWHYTCGDSLLKIIEDQLIKTTDLYIAPGEKPITWFSSNQFWEETVIKRVIFKDHSSLPVDMGITLLVKYGIGAFRIGVEPGTAPHDWNALRQLSGMPPEIARGLVRAAKEVRANPREWFGTFDPVPAKQWVSVQQYTGERWIDVDHLRVEEEDGEEPNSRAIQIPLARS